MKLKIEELRSEVSDLAAMSGERAGELSAKIKSGFGEVSGVASERVKEELKALSPKIDLLAQAGGSRARELEIEIKEKLGHLKWRV